MHTHRCERLRPPPAPAAGQPGPAPRTSRAGHRPRAAYATRRLARAITDPMVLRALRLALTRAIPQRARATLRTEVAPGRSPEGRRAQAPRLVPDGPRVPRAPPPAHGPRLRSRIGARHR